MDRLRFVALHLTQKCSHECAFCYYRVRSPGVGQSHSDWPTDKLFAILSALGAASVEEVYFIGGDPAEHPDILPIATHAKKAGLKITSISNTHQYRCDHDELARVIPIFESTIHGPSAETHDSLCGRPGAYDQVLSELRRFNELGCSTGITINMTPGNASSIYDTVDAIRTSFGDIVRYVNIQRIVPYGRAESNDPYYLSRHDVMTALSQIDALARDFRIEVQCEDAIPLCVIPKRYWGYVHRCEWGSSKLSLNGDGGVSRCGTDPRYGLGNMLDRPIMAIWEESSVLQAFRRRAFLPAKCRECRQLERCGGGCVLGCWSGQELGVDPLLLLDPCDDLDA